MQTLYFLGRFHVLALHLPIGVVVAAVLADALSRRERFRDLAAARRFLWGLAALGAVVTAVLGYLHLAEGGFDGPSAVRHRAFGTATALACVAVWASLLRTRPLRGQQVAGIAVLALVFVTGHYGGNLTHGETFLVEHAPAPLRRLAGLAPERQPVTDLADADPYEDLVRPILERRCVGCHNADKRRGGLDLSTLAALVAGGEHGPVVVAGDPDASELLRRVRLPREDEAAMPAEGKAPLDADQIDTLQWWIESGAPRGAGIDVAALGEPRRRHFAAALGLATADQPMASRADATTPAPNVDESLVRQLVDAGFMVRQRSVDDSGLIVGVVDGQSLDAARRAALAAAAPFIVDLDLHGIGIVDADLRLLADASRLERLNLAGNALTDASVTSLPALPALRSLVLFGNRGVGDLAVGSLSTRASLTKVFLRNTAASANGAGRLRRARPDSMWTSIPDRDQPVFARDKPGCAWRVPPDAAASVRATGCALA